jgi:hypothetical protein
MPCPSPPPNLIILILLGEEHKNKQINKLDKNRMEYVDVLNTKQSELTHISVQTRM